MKNLLKNHENIIYILIIVGVSFVTSLSAYAATTYEYNSADVWYDNSTSHLSSSNVKGALDELHSTATNYTDITTRTNALDAYFPEKTYDGRTLHPYTYEGANIGANSATGQNAWIDFYYNGVMRGSIAATGNYDNGIGISAHNASGTSGEGTLNLIGNPVQINGTDVAFLTYTGNLSSSTGVTNSSFPKSTWTNLDSLTLSDPGTYIIEGACSFASNSTGSRFLYLVSGSGTSPIDYLSGDGTSGVSSPTYLNVHTIVTISSSTTYRLRLYQASGGTLSTWARLYATRIK